MKHNSDLIKEVLVKYLKDHPGIVKVLYESGDQIDETELANVKIWKRTSKANGIQDGTTERCYCPKGSKQENLVDDLVVIVTTTKDDGELLDISVEA